MSESQNMSNEPWQPHRGPFAKLIAWMLLILIFAGLLVMMIYD
jgi:hypothetical protein